MGSYPVLRRFRVAHYQNARQAYMGRDHEDSFVGQALPGMRSAQFRGNQNAFRNTKKRTPESTMATGSVSTQASARLRTVDH